MKKQRKNLASYVENNETKFILYNTMILKYMHNSNSIMLNSGGYKTNHTKNCINDNLPDSYRVFQKNHVWYVTTPKDVLKFKDNMVINLGE